MGSMPDPEVRVATFSPTAISSGDARRFVTELLLDWGRAHLVDDTALCVSELAANAVLHSRSPFTLAVRRTGDGVRVDVLDPCPDQLPVPVPTSGSAADLTGRSTTGRGLQIVAALSTRWGVSTAEGAKSVWVELSDGAHPDPNDAVIVIGHHRTVAPGQSLSFPGLPVRAAVASGIQVDEVVRELQLALLGPGPAEEPTRLFELLERSAPVRLAGRYAALQAAAECHTRFDLELAVSDAALSAVGSLNQLLRGWPGRSSASSPDRDGVDRLRAWLVEETVRQQAGHPPRRCPLPA